MITITLSCDGCTAKAEGTQGIRKIFEQRTQLFGGWRPFDIDKAIPDGWVASDPYTGCCYCPKCVESIWPADGAGSPLPEPIARLR